MNLGILLEIGLKESHRIYGENNYAFASGYFKGFMDEVIYELNLTKEQEKRLEKFLSEKEKKFLHSNRV